MKSKTPSIQIHDAKRTVNGKKVQAYRVKSVAKNGEILAVSEVLNDSKAVKKNISAMVSVWDSGVAFRELPGGTKIYDHTKKQSFAVSGFANPNK